MAKPIHPAIKAWFVRMESFTEKHGWLPLPMSKGVLRFYGMCRHAVKTWKEEWPSWEELDAGAMVMAGWEPGWIPTNPTWILAKSKAGYPNILALRNHGRKAKTDDSPDTPRYSERYK